MCSGARSGRGQLYGLRTRGIGLRPQPRAGFLRPVGPHLWLLTTALVQRRT
jgi:hypothetical protein